MATPTYRSIWRWHFHAGMFCIPFVIVLALSGSIYLFKPQIDAFADRAVDSLEFAGPRASAEAQVDAAIAAVPASRLFAYELPPEADDAVRVHVYSADGSGRIVYVHPQTLAMLKIVPHTSRFTEWVKTLHGELLAGTAGSVLVELAAGWAAVMLITGIYLWWPRESRGAAGVLYPRFSAGRRVFWRDLHAVTGMWISSLALFLLVTALPWTTVWGAGFKEIRAWAAAAPVQQSWSQSRGDEHEHHRRDGATASVDTQVTMDQVIAAVRPFALAPPVRLYRPNEAMPFWRVRSESPNLPLQRELDLHAQSGAILAQRRFADKLLTDRVVGIGIAAHQGQLFGLANQLLGLATALGLVTLCVSSLVMWWRRRPAGKLGIPAPAVQDFRIGPKLGASIATLGIMLPMLGASLLLIVSADAIATRMRS